MLSKKEIAQIKRSIKERNRLPGECIGIWESEYRFHPGYAGVDSSSEVTVSNGELKLTIKGVGNDVGNWIARALNTYQKQLRKRNK